MEIWKDVKDCKGLYQVSNFGSVKSLKFNKEHILKPSSSVGGYKQLVVYRNDRPRNFYVHQLVAEAFLNHIPYGRKLVVNHINYNRTDNRVENLEIVTQRENTNKKNLKSTSKYTGVSWNKKNKKWVAQIRVNNKSKKLGHFDDEKEASEYYENALIAIQNGAEIIVKGKICTSKYKGVSFSKLTKKWVASIYINKKCKTIGHFKNEIDAHNAYQNALKNKVLQSI